MAHARAPRTTAAVTRAKRERRVPWIALGLLLVFGAGLGFAAWSRAMSTRSLVLVAVRDVATGETVAIDAVGTADVGAGPEVHTVAASDLDLVVGRVARGPIPAGSVLSPEKASHSAVMSCALVVSSSEIPRRDPSPSSCWKRGVSCGVETTRMSRMPASISVLSG
jgi:hypothetical protein